MGPKKREKREWAQRSMSLSASSRTTGEQEGGVEWAEGEGEGEGGEGDSATWERRKGREGGTGRGVMRE